MNELSTIQQECVDFRGAALFCVAGPGSGKTRTLTHAIADRVRSSEVPPSHIMAVTFTRLAALEMRTRLYELIPQQVRAIRIGTFHSICYDMIRDHWQMLGYASPEILVYDRHEQRRLLKEVIATSRHTPTQSAVLKALDQQAQSGEPLSELELSREVHKVAEAYLRALKEHNAVDYATVPFLALRLIEMDLPTTWTDIFVDEAQDLDPLQYRVFRLLQPERVFFVGDPDQLIYGWRGANVELMRTKASMLDAQVKILSVNYRSTPEIIGCANDLIANNQLRIEKQMELPEALEHGYVSVVPEANQLDAIATEWREADTHDYRIAVLGRTNDLIIQLSNNLISREIPHELIGRREKLLERQDVKDLLAYLCFKDYPLSPTILSRVLAAHGCSDLDIERVCMEAKQDGHTFYETVLRLFEPLSKFFSELDDEPSLLQKISIILARYRSLAGTMSQLDGKDLLAIAANFIRLSQWEERNAGNFMSWLSLRDGQDDIAASDERLQLMTIHAAKGLEFDTVFITGLHDRVLPHKRNQEGEGLEEERRLMFVAMTRARRRLILVSSDWPSRFIEEATRYAGRG